MRFYLVLVLLLAAVRAATAEDISRLPATGPAQPAQSGLAEGPRLDVIKFAGRALNGNPLHDPVVRRIAVFIPAQYTNGERLPIVYYLPGWGGSSENFIRDQTHWRALTQKLADEVTPMLLVVVDARTHWGGSQYLNSPAQGNYADYVCRDVVSEVESRYPAPTNGVRRIIAGHSSGGFGALRLGMADQKLFDGVIALSPDSDFPTSHLPLVTLPGVTNATLEEVELLERVKSRRPPNDDLAYALGLSAAYAPRGTFFPGQFNWLYDLRGNFREGVWLLWLANDPLTLVEGNPLAFSASQRVYLDGAAKDEYSANIGARKIYEVIRHRPGACAFYEPPGRHSQHVPERLERGLAWVFGTRMVDVK